jgi:hypothetical protein
MGRESAFVFRCSQPNQQSQARGRFTRRGHERFRLRIIVVASLFVLVFEDSRIRAIG